MIKPISIKRYIGGFLTVLLITCFNFSEANAQNSEGPADDARQAINQVNKQFMQAWEEGNAAGVAKLYTKEALFFAPHAEPIKGQKATTKYVQGAINAGLNRIELETTEFEQFDDIAHEWGGYTLYTPNDQVADHGKYMIIWKRQDGKWQIHWDMYNTSRPKPKSETQ